MAATQVMSARLTAQPGMAVVRLDDLEREATHAPPDVAVLFRALAKPADEQYEQFALTKIEQFLGKAPALVNLQAADKALSAVLHYHAAAHPHPLGGPSPWAEVEKRLERTLREVRRQQLGLLAARAKGEPEWTAVLARAEGLRELYANSRAVLSEVAGIRLRYAEERLARKDYPAVRAQLAQVEEQGLPSAAERKHLEALRHRLEQVAQALVNEAAGQQDPATASARLRDALAIWPALPGLQDELLRRQNAYTILYVGIGELPDQLSPATAWMDAETQAVELLFERLVEPRYDQQLGQFYRPALAVSLPALLPGGRRFRLAQGARWSDGKPVTSVDVRHTVQLLGASGRAPEWEDLLQVPRVEDDPRRIDFQFRQMPFDPLAPLAFQVLPPSFRGRALFRTDDDAFAKSPVGSGPYRYAGRQEHDGRTCAVFTANPYYHRLGLPRVREVRFFVSRDPVADLRHPTRPMHLFLDLPTDRIDALRAVSIPEIHTLKSRRVTFLAVNHRVPALADQNLRRALAHAINRERILNDRFRGIAVDIHGWTITPRLLHPEFHQALNGPFPARSWANDPAVPAEPRDTEAYRARLDLAKAYARQSGIRRAELTLKFPHDDPRVARACHDLADQVAQLSADAGFSLRLKLLPLSPRELKADVDRHDYELAYFHLDYADESYWLWPLFDTRPEALRPGGSNFLGYKNDDVLGKLFRDTMGQRDFARLREGMQALHARLYERMPLIPLWQLDMHVAVHPDLTLSAARLDPLRVFAGMEEWTLRPRAPD